MKAYLNYIFLLLGIVPCRAQELTTASKELKASYLENRQRVLSNMKDQTSHLLFAARFRYRLHQELSNQYKKWERLYPKVVAIPVAMAEFDPENAISHLKQALKIDSANIDVLERLADQYRSTGDFISEVKYRKKIHRLAPSNATYAYNYVTAFSMIAPLKYRLKLAWLTEAYPDSPERIDALYQLYVSSRSQKERKALFLEAYNTKHPKQAVKTGQYYFAANRFYELLDTNIDSAFFFSQKMISDKMQPQPYWKDKHRVAKSLCRANQLIQRDSSAKALSILDTLDLVADKWRIEHVKAENCIALMREEAMLKQGDYHQYLQAKLNAYSACPNKSLRTQLLNAGNRLGLDSIEIMKRVWNRRDSLSYLITDFDYKNLHTGDSLHYVGSLKGKPTLLAFWFVKCGPCLREFPYFEKTVSKFKDSINYLAPNVIEEENYLISSFSKRMGYSFTPVSIKQTFRTGAEGVPFNLLLDEQGNVVFSGFRVGEGNPESLEMMLNELLGRKEARSLATKEEALVDTLANGNRENSQISNIHKKQR